VSRQLEKDGWRVISCPSRQEPGQRLFGATKLKHCIASCLPASAGLWAVLPLFLLHVSLNFYMFKLSL
jgi:hypothetical protein